MHQDTMQRQITDPGGANKWHKDGGCAIHYPAWLLGQCRFPALSPELSSLPSQVMQNCTAPARWSRILTQSETIARF